jgi:ferrous iron transport protein A
MPMISTCPRCTKQVSIPSGVDAKAEVLCPLCDAKYALSEALALAPPELIPVVSVAAEAVGCVKRTTGDPVERPTATDEDKDEDDVVDTVMPPLHLDDDRDEAAAVAERLPTMSVAAQLRRRRSRSAWRTVFEVVTGGLAGCLVAYYALAFWFGPQFNKYLPQLPLPFIPQLTAPRPGGGHPSEQPPLEEPVHRRPGSAAKPTDARPVPGGEARSCKGEQNVIQLGEEICCASEIVFSPDCRQSQFVKHTPPVKVIPLRHLPAGRCAKIAEVVGHPDHVHRLDEFGLRGGTMIEMFRPGNPCIIRLAGNKVCLRADDLLSVLVAPTAA